MVSDVPEVLPLTSDKVAFMSMQFKGTIPALNNPTSLSPPFSMLSPSYLLTSYTVLSRPLGHCCLVNWSRNDSSVTELHIYYLLQSYWYMYCVILYKEIFINDFVEG